MMVPLLFAYNCQDMCLIPKRQAANFPLAKGLTVMVAEICRIIASGI
jgi:hypothetical protein